MRNILFVILLCFMMTHTVSSQSDDSVEAWLAFSATTNSTQNISQLFLQNLDTGDVTQLVDQELGVGQVRFSPDCQFIAYNTSSQESPNELYMVTRIKGTNNQLTTSIDNNSIVLGDWSPDGRYISYKIGTTLMIYDLETTMQYTLALNARFIGNWSADSTRIVYTTVDNALHIYNMEDEVASEIIEPSPGQILWSLWSPTDDLIAYPLYDFNATRESDVADATRLFLYNFEDVSTTEIMGGDTILISAWSGDGDSLAFWKIDHEESQYQQFYLFDMITDDFLHTSNERYSFQISDWGSDEYFYISALKRNDSGSFGTAYHIYAIGTTESQIDSQITDDSYAIAQFDLCITPSEN